MERFIQRAKRLSRIRAGVLGPYLDSFVNELCEQGYSVDVIGAKIRLAVSFGDWLESKHLAAADVSSSQIEKYLRQREQRPDTSTDLL